MEEKVLQNKKNGMAVMLVNLLVLALSVAGIIVGGIMMDGGSVFGMILMIVSIVVLCVGWIPLIGLKVLKPQ